MVISLAPLLSDNINHVEIYLTNNIINKDIIDIKSNDSIIDKIYDKYKNMKSIKPVKYMSYYKNELVYLYDLSNDNQLVYSKLKQDDLIITPNIYIVSYKYSKAPIHLFPCSNNIDNTLEYTLIEYKITNRLSLIIHQDNYCKYVYIEYKHSPNVDIDKIEQTINNIIHIITS
jgi:hypothetical protein